MLSLRFINSRSEFATSLKLAVYSLAIGTAIAVGIPTVFADSEHANDKSFVRIAVDVPYPPFEYRNADGKLAGFEIDLGNELCRRANLECQWVVQGWDGIIPGLLARKYDAILSSMRITPAREKKVRFTDPYAMSPKVWVARADQNITLDDPKSLAGMSVGVQRGTTQDSYVTMRYSDSLDIRRYDTASDVALDMESERIDLAFINYPVAIDTLMIDMDDSSFTQIGPRINSPESIFGKGNAIAVLPRNEALAESFNQALDSVYSDGTFVDLMKQYFDYDLRPASRL